MRFTQCFRIKCTELMLADQNLLKYVPKHQPVLAKDIKYLEDFLMSKPNILILTGAGISTESGRYLKIKNYAQNCLNILIV